MGSADRLAGTTRLGAVHLRVVDIDAALAVWHDAVGMRVLERSGATARIGVDATPQIVLHATATGPLAQKSRDLFHVAVHVTTRRALANVAARLRAAGLRHSGQDHLISESLYVSDPSGNGIEICFDTPGRVARTEETSDGRISLIARDGSPHSGLEPLDVDDLLRELDGPGQVDAWLPVDAFIGHIHMRARSPETLMAFYLDVLGFRPHIQSRSFGMFDCGTDVRPHMIAFNTWAGSALSEPASGAAGLEYFTIELGSAEQFAAVTRRLKAAGAAIMAAGGGIADPEGNRLQLVVRPD